MMRNAQVRGFVAGCAVLVALLGCQKSPTVPVSSRGSQTEAPSAISNTQPVQVLNKTPSYLANIPGGFVGTYLPSLYVEQLQVTKSHTAALRASNTAGFYPVLAVSTDSIHSNNNYDDEGALVPTEFEHNWTSQETSTITDGKGNAYRKISEDPAYGMVLERYYFAQLLGNKQYEDDKGNTLAADPEGGIRLNGDRYYLNLYGLRGQVDTMDLVVSRELHKTYGFQIRDGMVGIYEVKFKQVEGPELIVDDGSVTEAYTFPE